MPCIDVEGLGNKTRIVRAIVQLSTKMNVLVSKGELQYSCHIQRCDEVSMFGIFATDKSFVQFQETGLKNNVLVLF